MHDNYCVFFVYKMDIIFQCQSMAAIAMNPLTSQAMSTPIASTSNFMDYTGANGAGNIEQSSSVPTTGFPQPFYMRPAYRFKTIAVILIKKIFSSI